MTMDSMNTQFIYINHKLKIIRAESSDREKIFSIIREIAIDELGFPEEALDFYQNLLIEFPKEYVFLKAVLLSEIVGITIGAPPQGGVGTILWLLVRSKWRNYNIGTKLFNEICKEYSLLGCHKVKLTATTKNAVVFYKSKGMEVEGFHSKHWWGMDFWSLGKFL